MAKGIKVGKATKYSKVKFSPAPIVAMYKAGKKVSEIARAVGYPAGHGNNRVRRVLEQAGIYKVGALQGKREQNATSSKSKAKGLVK